MRLRASAAILLGGLLGAGGCGGEGAPTVVPSPTPVPTPTPGPAEVVVGAHTGPTQITFLAAEPAPGATLEGCGSDARGCAGRVRMRFRLLSASGGPVLDAIGFLHATTKLACYQGTTGRLDLAPGAAREIEILFAQADPACAVPATISDMKLVLSGPGETASLQEWAVRYELRP
jgi:hypothetical protein